MNRRPGLLLSAALTLLVACTGVKDVLVGPISPRPSPSASQTASQPQANPLCKAPPTGAPGPAASKPLPGAIARVAGQIQQVRGLKLTGPVMPEALTRAQIERQLRISLERQFPAEVADRQDRAWTTVGLIPAKTDLHRAVSDFGTSQIVGYYDTQTHRLVFEGGETSPTPYERFILAHELTHALQDQHFDLSRLDELSATCQDERAEALLSLAEGDALETQILWARQDLTSEEIAQLQSEASAFPPPPASTPEFVRQMFLFPYGNGQAFVQALMDRGGKRAVNDAFRNPPVSTEQVLHPSKYPGDTPQAVAIPDLSTALGAGWSLLDHEEIGEGWLLMMLELRLSVGDAEDAAAGWDGGLLRAWANGSDTAVLIQTVWDSERDAGEFAKALRKWMGDQAAEVLESGTTVRAMFGSSPGVVGLLRGAIQA